MIDTLKLTQGLVKAGMAREQAEAIADSVASGLKDAAATREDISVLRSGLKTDMKELEATMIKWMVGLTVPVYAIMIGLLLKLSH